MHKEEQEIQAALGTLPCSVCEGAKFSEEKVQLIGAHSVYSRYPCWHCSGTGLEPNELYNRID